MADDTETYVVVEDFTDTLGRAWKEGDEFVVTEDATCTQAALDAEQIELSTPDKIQKGKEAKEAKAEAEAERLAKEEAERKEKLAAKEKADAKIAKAKEAAAAAGPKAADRPKDAGPTAGRSSFLGKK